MNPLNVVTNQDKGLTWQAWLERNRLQDAQGLDLRTRLTKYAAVAVLFLTILLWSYAGGYDLLVRFAVCAGAVRVAFLAAAARRYTWATLFVGMAILYNPVLPVFPFSGRLYLVIVIASIAPFAASLVVPRPRLARSVAAR